MFDEISVEPGLTYDMKDDRVIGFEDYLDDADRNEYSEFCVSWQGEFLENGNSLLLTITRKVG